ncbi:MAG: TrbI/VirB10 family protein [Gemmatimonadetes bacterium]|nr:TrbI/VirB10 family protein [Candidatus Palauibacter rhopaloidicola]
MSRWKQLVRPPKGALPGGIVTKAGIVLIAVLVAGLLFSSSLSGPDENAPVTGTVTEARAVDDRVGRAFEGRLLQEAEREIQRAAAESRDDAASREAAGASETVLAAAEGGRSPRATSMGRAEAELRETLRLEEIERRARSIRSLPVAQSHRNRGEARGDAAPPNGDVRGPDFFEDALEGTLTSFERSLAVLENEVEAGLTGGGLTPGGSAPQSPAPPATARVAPEPRRMVCPDELPGWERIYEGSFLEAVLLTQLSGDFPGPVLAMVSVPLYSVDRQRVLIPRGARIVGTAQAVQDRDQSRLAVTFHRLLLPGGGWIDLEFVGMDQAGDSALKDQVNRHYFSTFAAAGAVGALSGLTLAGGSPYGLRAGVGQGLAGSTTSTLDRFLNRMPEITIRAGHRLRVWFTADVLVPNPSIR